MNGLTPLELMELKPFLVKAMGVLQSLEPKQDAEEDDYGATQD
jgi:GINS complex subunit 2